MKTKQLDCCCCFGFGEVLPLSFFPYSFSSSSSFCTCCIFQGTRFSEVLRSNTLWSSFDVPFSTSTKRKLYPSTLSVHSVIRKTCWRNVSMMSLQVCWSLHPLALVWNQCAFRAHLRNLRLLYRLSSCRCMRAWWTPCRCRPSRSPPAWGGSLPIYIEVRRDGELALSRDLLCCLHLLLFSATISVRLPAVAYRDAVTAEELQEEPDDVLARHCNGVHTVRPPKQGSIHVWRGPTHALLQLRWVLALPLCYELRRSIVHALDAAECHDELARCENSLSRECRSCGCFVVTLFVCGFCCCSVTWVEMTPKKVLSAA